MYLPYKASKKVILKWIDSFDGEFSHFKNTTYQNLLPHKILEMQPPLQSIQSWKCGPTQRHISTSLLIENTFPQALTIDELRGTSLLQFLISQRITDIKILCIITIKLIRLLVFFFQQEITISSFRVCVKDLAGMESQHDPVTLDYVVIGGR